MSAASAPDPSPATPTAAPTPGAGEAPPSLLTAIAALRALGEVADAVAHLADARAARSHRAAASDAS